MFCRNCGKELTGSPEICPNCGAKPMSGTSFCSNCGAPTTELTMICHKCGIRLVKVAKAQPQGVKKISKKKIIGFGVVLVIAILLVVGVSTCVDIITSPGPTPNTTEVTLNAKVSYDNGQFIIANNDDFAWTDVKFDLNYGTWTSGYTYHADRLDANNIYTVGSMQFAKSDGTMFNPFTQKPLKMSIHCKTPDGKDGWYFGSWE